MSGKSFYFVCLILLVASWDIRVSESLKTDPLFAFPDHAKPERIGKLAVENLLEREHMIRASGSGIHYAEICAADGAIRFAGLTKDSNLMSRLRDRYSCFIDSAECSLMPEEQIRYIAAMNILSMHHFNHDAEFLELTLDLVKGKWDSWADAEVDPAYGIRRYPSASQRIIQTHHKGRFYPGARCGMGSCRAYRGIACPSC
jgi:hypothetical protein